jgi:hypothetical protein
MLKLAVAKKVRLVLETVGAKKNMMVSKFVIAVILVFYRY